MKIPFKIKGETIYLVCDDHNYCFAKLLTRKRNGEVVEEMESFKWFADLNHALGRLIDMRVKESDAKTLLELKEAITSAREEVNSVWTASAEAR